MIKFAVIGCGYIGKRHIEMINKNRECNLMAACDVKQINITNVPCFQNVDNMLNSGINIEVVSICTPNGLHATQAIKCLEAGKHVIIEKPMALRKSDCEAIVYKSLQMNKRVFCVMQNRYSPPSEWLKKIVSNGILGDIFMVQLNCYWNRDERYYKGGWKGTKDMDGGCLFTQFSHWIDILYWCFGDIKNIKANFADFNHKELTEFEDSGFVNFDFVNGGMGAINFSTAVWGDNLESSITVIGSNGSVKIGGQYMDKVEYCHIKDYSLPELKKTNEANDYGTHKGSAANHNYIYENVIQTLKGDNTVTTNAIEGMKVVEIIENIYLHKSLAYGRN